MEPTTARFKAGDQLTWKPGAGHVGGKVHLKDTQCEGCPRRASAGDPQYAIKSDKREHIDMGSALKKSSV